MPTNSPGSADALLMPRSFHPGESIEWYQALSVKLVILVAVVTMMVMGVFALVTIRSQTRQLIREVIAGATQFSETVKRSTYHDMLRDQRDNVYRIMETIGAQKGIEKVRIFNKDGKIMFSTDKKEVGRLLDKKAEVCYVCHAIDKPLERIDTEERSRIFVSDKGYRVLGMITPVYNEAACYTAPCHFHPQSQKTLGVIDISMSLVDIDAQLKKSRIFMRTFTIASIIAISVLIGLFIQAYVNRPIRNLVSGTRRISQGDLDYRIDVNRKDEMGYLASSFNQMTDALKNANDEIQEWIRTLEEKVEKRTRELKDAQAQLIQSEKLTSLGKLAATVAHEINNPLAGVLTYIKLISRKLTIGPPGDEERKEFLRFLSTMERETERTSNIVKNLLRFSRQSEPSLQKVQIIPLIEEVLSILTHSITLNSIKVEKRFNELPVIVGDPDQLKQAFLNIIVNACDAMKERKELTIITNYLKEKNIVEIQVKDTGVGIPEENLSKIFDPFFTTKEKGSGLGLSVVYGIIRNHDGEIRVTSRVGEGTTMTLLLPVKNTPLSGE